MRTQMNRTLMPAIFWMLGALSAVGSAATAEVPYESSFADGAKDWTAVNRATVSDVARRPGGKSLLIIQSNDEEQNSAWLSPVLKNPGKSVRVSLWAADNYDNQKDSSFAAAFEVIPCDKDGNLASAGGDWTHIPWDDKRQMPQYRHTFTREGLRWKHYEAVKRPGGDFFRVRLCWPKTRIQGECYFTDIRVAAAAEHVPAAPQSPLQATGTPPSRYALEISTGVTGNLFYVDDPFRFEFLLFPTDGKPIEPFAEPVIQYEITDYERFHVAAGTLPFAGAAPVTVGKRDRNRDRSVNLRLSALFPDAAAREVGREFFLHAKLVDVGRVIAEDTVTYGVVDPRRTDPAEYDRCRFIAFGEGGGFRNTESKHQGQTIADKMGVSLTHSWD